MLDIFVIKLILVDVLNFRRILVLIEKFKYFFWVNFELWDCIEVEDFLIVIFVENVVFLILVIIVFVGVCVIVFGICEVVICRELR